MRTPDLAALILEYLREHPDGADTLEGIATWWVLQNHVREDVSDVGDALRFLVVHGHLVERQRAGQDSTYALNKGSAATE